MQNYIKSLEKIYTENANPEYAEGQKAYMKNRFDFLGIKTPLRREISKAFLKKQNLPEKKDSETIIKYFWNKPQREFQYFAQELCFKYAKQYEQKDIKLFEFMITNKSWWDTVDLIASKILGEYFKKFPEQIKKHTDNWLKSGNIWLQRSAVLFQLKYKDKTDFELLSYIIISLSDSKEFFINKAIGWILREYGKTNPQRVKSFVENNKLSPLSRKEALRIIIKK